MFSPACLLNHVVSTAHFFKARKILSALVLSPNAQGNPNQSASEQISTMFNSKQSTLLSFFQRKLSVSDAEVQQDLSSMPCASVLVNSNVQRDSKSENDILPKDRNDSGNCEKPQKRKFQEKWLEEFPWIIYDGLAKCRFCCNADVKVTSSKFLEGFRGPFKHETFKFHDKSAQHRKNVDIIENSSQLLVNTPLAKCIKKMDAKMFKQLKVLFNVSYYIAKNNKPFSDIESLTILSRKLEVDVQNQYANRNACSEFISCISEVITESVLKELKQSQFISIILDASTDKGTIEELIVYARYLKSGIIEECFLGLLELDNSTSESYFSAIEKQFASLGLDFKNNSWIVGLATDGAANMVGEKAGLCAKFKECLPHILTVHCVAHRLQLSILYALKNVSYLVIFDSVLILIYKFYGHSSKKIKQLQKIATLLAHKILKIQKLHQVRWVASKVGVLRAIFQNYQPILLHLENETNENGKQGSEKANGIVKKIKDFRFVATLSFLLDFLQIFKDLSLVFQKQHLLLCQVNNEVLKAKKNLENLQQERGKYEEQFFGSFNGENYKDFVLTNVASGRKFFKSDRNNMLDFGKKYLMERFCDINSSVITSTCVFDTFTWPTGKDLSDFGDNEIKNILDQFKKVIKHKNNEKDIEKSVINEWFDFKISSQNLKVDELLLKLTAHKEKFFYISQLFSILCVIPASTSTCERGFSQMNLVKNHFRTSLGNRSVNNLLNIHINGTSLENFDPADSIDKWYFGGGTRHVQGHKRKFVDS